MKVEKIPVLEIDVLSKLMQDYIKESPEIEHLYDYSKDIASFKAVIENKSKENINRAVLVNELSKQYEGVENTDLVMQNINSLANEKTFTVTTAHQLCLFTGPLYFIYKSISAIKLSMLLKEEYPDYNFVPIFWLGSEDHDFDEINHLNIQGEKVSWESGQNGAVGRMKNTNISKTLNQLSKYLYGQNGAPLLNFLKDTFKEKENYAESFIKFLHHLFGAYGLVVLEQDNFEFKKLFVEVIEKELFNSLVENNIQKELNFIDKNYKVQAKPRSINIFYMIDGLRERIEQNGEQFIVVNTDISFSQKELSKELKNHPDRFSPNVLLRPLYQESILPNLAYIGGGGELAYWLQLRNLFHSQERKMPMLLLRDMGLVINAKTTKNIEKITLDKKCLFKNKELLISELVVDASSKDVSLKENFSTLEKMYNSVLLYATNIDKSLELHVLAQQKKASNSLRNIEQKMLRAEKKNHEVLIEKINAIKDQLFPDKKLQERHDNFLPYYVKYGNGFFDILINNFNPIKCEIKLILEDE